MDPYCPGWSRGNSVCGPTSWGMPQPGKSSDDLAKSLGPATALLSFFTTTDHALLFLLRAGWRMPPA